MNFKKLKEILIPAEYRKTLSKFNADRKKIFQSKKGNVQSFVELNQKYTYKPNFNILNILDEIKQFKSQPLISIVVPVYNVDVKWLKLAISSVEKQFYTNWELCIADDCSTNQETIQYLKSIKNSKIKIAFLENNVNISAASNAAIALATGEYIGLLDNDDELTPDALFEVVKAINNTGAELIYSDEDKLNMDNEYCHPYFKSDFSLDLLLSNNYLCHFSVIKIALIHKIGGFEVGLEGAQDFDLMLKCVENTNKIHHIDKVLYHWRMIPGSTASEFSAKSYAQDAGKQSLMNFMQRNNIDGAVLDGFFPGSYRLKRNIQNNPCVSIIIPFKDKADLLKTCIDSILKESTYQNWEIIGISNNSTEQETFDLIAHYENLDDRIKFHHYNIPFNYSKLNNYALQFTKGEHLILLNNDIEIITKEWIENLLEHSQREDVGAVGAKLYYPNDTVQHAGVIIGLGGIAGHCHKHYNRNDHGYFGKLNLTQNLSAVTGACIMIKKELYEKINGFDEVNLSVAFNDVDFCLRLRELNYLNVYTPYCEAYHHESISRGTEDTEEKKKRFQSESDFTAARHYLFYEKGDPYYNSNLSLTKDDYSLK
jgi:glycosyltransferase involved in cell wall biosynthesis